MAVSSDPETNSLTDQTHMRLTELGHLIPTRTKGRQDRFCFQYS